MQMRVWKISDGLWIAGPTLLRAVRAAQNDLGYGFREMVETIDGDTFREVSDWRSTPVFCPDEPDGQQDRVLGDTVREPGVAMCSDDWL